jgi:hypothetical protein
MVVSVEQLLSLPILWLLVVLALLLIRRRVLKAAAACLRRDREDYAHRPLSLRTRKQLVKRNGNTFHQGGNWVYSGLEPGGQNGMPATARAGR